jgi:hypothetical protein
MMAWSKGAMNRHVICPFMIAGQLQVLMQTVGLGFSRKSHHAGITARGICSVRNIPGPAGITFGEETVAGICADVPAYNLIVAI